MSAGVVAALAVLGDADENDLMWACRAKQICNHALKASFPSCSVVPPFFVFALRSHLLSNRAPFPTCALFIFARRNHLLCAKTQRAASKPPRACSQCGSHSRFKPLYLHYIRYTRALFMRHARALRRTHTSERSHAQVPTTKKGVYIYYIGANNKEKRVFVALSFHATYTFHSDTGADYMACRQRLRTADVTAVHVGKGGVFSNDVCGIL